ncbi:MAG TPA: enoyl-CoA hydratase/isomerase family protein, partial [Deltaproteobacteria bacterium]|nr:enoyl-CoA hydratase/isomerase family protein [Deltaproteobacteria bacterium]
IRIASENALFGQPEINLGIIPGAGVTQRLPRLIGLTKAKEMLFRGKPIDAQEAYRIGLVNRVVPQDELVAACGELADELASQPYIALTVTKDVVNRGINVDLQSALAIEARAFALLFATEDQKEGVQAFLEKRKPNFQGK